MSYSQNKLNRFQLKLLALLTAVVGAVAGLYTTQIVLSKPEGWYDNVIVSMTEDRQKAFWCNTVKNTLQVVDLRTEVMSPVLNINVTQVEWSPTGDTLYVIMSDDRAKRKRFASVTVDGWKVQLGPFASHFAQTPVSGQVLLLGQGDYLSKNQVPEVRAYQLGEQDTHTARSLFDRVMPAPGGYAAARVSTNGYWFGIGLWGYNDPDAMEVYQLADWRKTLSHDLEASHFLFGPDNKRLVTVRSTAGEVQLHDFDLATGTLVQSSPVLHGSCDAADATADFSEIAIAHWTRLEKNHIKVFATDSLSQVSTVTVPGERSIVDLHFTEDGSRIDAIGRSGIRWQWNRNSNDIVQVSRLIPEARDERWAGAIVGLSVYGMLWVLMIVLRRKLSFSSIPTARSSAIVLLLTACFFEGLKLITNFLNPMFVISPGNFLLVHIHLVIGCTAIFYVAQIVILRIPTRLGITIGTALVLALGASLDFMLFYAAVVSYT